MKDRRQQKAPPPFYRHQRAGPIVARLADHLEAKAAHLVKSRQASKCFTNHMLATTASRSIDARYIHATGDTPACMAAGHEQTGQNTDWSRQILR